MAAPPATSAIVPSSPPSPSSPLPHHVLLATSLPNDPEAAARARRVVRDLLRQGRRPDMVDTACLLTSELVANATLHAGTAVELVVDLDPSRLSVEVIDANSDAPRPAPPEPLATAGRGLAMVAHLADSWGVTKLAPGKSVWFALSTEG